jgi:hypothetical protein
MTNMGYRFDDQKAEEKELPCFTFWPFSAFKKRGLFYTNEDFIRQTFEKEELFFNFERSDLSNKSLYLVEEVRGLSVGRCYMVCYLLPVKENEQIIIPLQTQLDLKSKKTYLLRVFC